MNKYRTKRAGERIIETYNALLKLWDVDIEERMLATRYGDTHVICAGDASAPPVVMFHGVGDDSALMWIYNAKALAAKYRLYAIDTIGGPGKSEPGAGYNKQFDDNIWIDDVFDALSLTRAHIIGVSHGGYMAQLYAVSRPERVDKVICISATVPVGGGGSPMKRMLKIFMPEALFPTKRNTYKLIRKLSGANPEAFTDSPLIMEHYQQLLKGFNNMAMSYHKVSAFSPEQVDESRDKVYYLAGERDPFQVLGGKRVHIDNNMNTRFYPDAGHGLNHERADDINQAIDDILSGRLTDLRAT